MDELGPESNDIIDQLIPTNLRELNAELNKTVRNLSKVDEQGKEQSAADWCSAIINGVTVAKQPYRAGYQEGLNERSAQWVEDIEQNVVETIEWFISRIGLAAAGKLCSLVAEKLTTEINPDLVNEASQNFDWSEDNFSSLQKSTESSAEEAWHRASQDPHPTEQDMLDIVYKS